MSAGRLQALTLRVVVASSLLAGAGTLVACSTGPTSREEVCQAYDDLGHQMIEGNGVFGNPLFHKADHLASVAKRYDDADLSADAKSLHDIAKSDSTSGAELLGATGRIANVCGHPLGTADLFGGD